MHEVATAAQSDVDKMEQLLAGAEAELDASEAALYGTGPSLSAAGCASRSGSSLRVVRRRGRHGSLSIYRAKTLSN